MSNVEIEYNNEIREGFIPIDYDELCNKCSVHLKLDGKMYRHFSTLLRTYYHQYFRSDLLELRQLYHPFNPDYEMLTLETLSLLEYEKRQKALLSKIDPLLNHANYNILTKEMLEKTMYETSSYSVEVNVDFEDFEEIKLYFRGESKQFELKRDPWKLYLVKKRVESLIYRRLFIVLKPKHINVRAKEISNHQGKVFNKVRRKLKRNNPLLVRGKANENIYIKLFKNIPRTDLKMLFPNSKVKIKLFDKVKLGVFGAGGTIAGGATFITELGAAIDPIAILIALGVFGGVLWRQVKEVIFHRTHYMAELSKKLYFSNLGNNAGALNNMVGTAEESESKEALLVYLFLSEHKGAITRERLDVLIEKYVKDLYGIEMDFEVDDGLRKLCDLGIVIEVDGCLHTIEVQEAISLLNDTLRSFSIS